MAKITVQNTVVTVLSYNGKDYIKVVEFDHFRMQAGLPSFVVNVSK